MKKLLRNSLIASVVAVAGATTFANQANAQSADVDFSGTVGNLCSITKVNDGQMGVADLINSDSIFTARPDESSQAQLGEIDVNCNTTGEISVGDLTPISADAISLSNESSYSRDAFVADSPANFTGGNELAVHTTNKTSVVGLNGTPQRLYVHAVAQTPGAIPAGNYTFRTTVTITPQ
ncbi:MAG: hypothetical protein HC836_43495 [Richelia sp. RM2_1_2]|nr:hypothetical protein [Richelia sp. SM2_1_7]NJN10569.1 hypothetical protein [Richelia sp. RM1_1_1]NJO64761.1 hypothetical protein [Richelia sp. RM2_1_2]